MKDKKTKARYGSGSLKQVGRFWHVRYREVKRLPDGKAKYIQHRESTHSEDREYAQRFLNKKLQEIGGRRPGIVDPKEVTYETLRDVLVENYIAKKKKSVRRGKLHFTRLDKFFGGFRVKDFTVKRIKDFRQECRRGPKPISDRTINRSISALRRMFNLAIQDELIELSDKPSYFEWVQEPTENLNAVFIEPEWYKKLCRTLTEPLRSAFIICYHTAMRPGEMQKLRWRNFNFKKKEIFLPREITKSGKERKVFIPSDFKLKPGQPDDLVFQLGDSHLGEWKRACVKGGFGGYRCRVCGAEWMGSERPASCTHLQRKLSFVGPHLKYCRHTAVRNMDDAGMSRDRGKAISGHASDSVYSTYNIGKDRDVDDARRLLEQAHRLRQARVK